MICARKGPLSLRTGQISLRQRPISDRTRPISVSLRPVFASQRSISPCQREIFRKRRVSRHGTFGSVPDTELRNGDCANDCMVYGFVRIRYLETCRRKPVGMAPGTRQYPVRTRTMQNLKKNRLLGAIGIAVLASFAIGCGTSFSHRDAMGPSFSAQATRAEQLEPCINCFKNGVVECKRCHERGLRSLVCPTCDRDNREFLLRCKTCNVVVSENGTYDGQVSDLTKRPRTIFVRGYYRKNGTYVRSHYRSPPGVSRFSRGPPANDPSKVAENGSYNGQISQRTGRPKTKYVSGYYRSDGTYVRGHYRSR